MPCTLYAEQNISFWKRSDLFLFFKQQFIWKAPGVCILIFNVEQRLSELQQVAQILYLLHAQVITIILHFSELNMCYRNDICSAYRMYNNCVQNYHPGTLMERSSDWFQWCQFSWEFGHLHCWNVLFVHDSSDSYCSVCPWARIGPGARPRRRASVMPLHQSLDPYSPLSWLLGLQSGS